MKIREVFTIVIFAKLLGTQEAKGASTISITDPLSSSSCQSCSSESSNHNSCKAKDNGTCGVPVSESTSPQEFVDPDPFQCGIYLATSSIPNAGFG